MRGKVVFSLHETISFLLGGFFFFSVLTAAQSAQVLRRVAERWADRWVGGRFAYS